MLQIDNRTKILRLFFNDPLPDGGFQLREISRKTRIAPPSVKSYLRELEKEHLIVKEIQRVSHYPVYRANRDNEYFKLLKRLDITQRIYESELLTTIADTCMPDAIILFGSSSRGDDVRESDIDLYVVSKIHKMNLDAYEKKLVRKINILFEEDFTKLSKELKNNIMNGTILKGYLKVFWMDELIRTSVDKEKDIQTIIQTLHNIIEKKLRGKK